MIPQQRAAIVTALQSLRAELAGNGPESEPFDYVAWGAWRKGIGPPAGAPWGWRAAVAILAASRAVKPMLYGPGIDPNHPDEQIVEIEETVRAAARLRRLPAPPSILETLDKHVRQLGGKPAEPIRLTEPMTLKQIGEWFTCHRNQVRMLVLAKYYHEPVGRKFRLRVRDMPPAYHVYHTKARAD